MTGLVVIQPGILSLIQDQGRFGQHHNGLTTAGPMDRSSHNWANVLCGNQKDCATIEVTMGGLVLESKLSTYFAVTGADVDLSINHQPVATWTLHKISVGDRIKLGFCRGGTRCYLAVAGGFDLLPTFGSVSTVCRESIGGLNGKGEPLKQNDELLCNNFPLATPRRLTSESIPKYLMETPDVTRLRVILGYQHNYFSDAQKQRFFNSEYAVSDLNDRMGYRLSGPPISASIDGILSEGICLGAIQIPADGQPIVLMNDRQTIGGYPKIGSVLSMDLDKLAQLPSQAMVRFEEISLEQSHNLLHLKHARDAKKDRHIDLNALSVAIEKRLVDKDLRGMASVRKSIEQGYYLRAARLIAEARGTVLIGTGFPVNGSFETDGPVGAIALYGAIERLGGQPVIVCDEPLFSAIKNNYRAHQIGPEQETPKQALERYKPSLVIAIERPGRSSDGRYYNMRGRDISDNCANFDDFMSHSSCPTIAIGDGGNEIGMGNVASALRQLDIKPSCTPCDELLVADVSNWAAHGIIALLSCLTDQDLVSSWNNLQVLKFLSNAGSVDGVTGENTLTEDGLPPWETEQLLEDLRLLSGY
jgi:biotin-dependent carboxylase-like uncharacterized protein